MAKTKYDTRLEAATEAHKLKVEHIKSKPNEYKRFKVVPKGKKFEIVVSG